LQKEMDYFEKKGYRIFSVEPIEEVYTRIIGRRVVFEEKE
jgi:predicted CoA-binding protein